MDIERQVYLSDEAALSIMGRVSLFHSKMNLRVENLRIEREADAWLIWIWINIIRLTLPKLSPE